MNNSAIGVYVVEEDPTERNMRIVSNIIELTMGSYQAYYARAALESGGTKLLVAYLDNRPIGVEIYYIVDVGVRLLVHYYVAVSPDYQHMHIGKTLVLSAEYLGENTEAYIATTTIDNKPARKLFTSLGYYEYTWIELEQLIGPENTYKLIQATCSHEDDLALIKPVEVTISQLLEKLEKTRLRTPWKLWKKICYKPWLRLIHY